MNHVIYPHEPGYLYDCPACNAQCHCTGPQYAECVYEGEHQTWSLANVRTEHVTGETVWHSVRGAIPLTLAEAQTIASWWQSPGAVGHVLASLASGCHFDARALVDDIDSTFTQIRRNPSAYPADLRDLHALREWVIGLCA